MILLRIVMYISLLKILQAIGQKPGYFVGDLLKLLCDNSINFQYCSHMKLIQLDDGRNVEIEQGRFIYFRWLDDEDYELDEDLDTDTKVFAEFDTAQEMFEYIQKGGD